MSTAIERRLKRLEEKISPSALIKVVLAGCQKTDAGRDALTCEGRVFEREDDETMAAFEGRVRREGGADKLIVLSGLTPITRLAPFVTTAGRVVVVSKKLAPGEEATPVPG